MNGERNCSRLGCGSVVEHLASMPEILGSIPGSDWGCSGGPRGFLRQRLLPRSLDCVRSSLLGAAQR